MNTSCMHLETMCSWSRPVTGLRGLVRVSTYFLLSNFWDASLGFCRWAAGQGSTQRRNLIQIRPSAALPPADSTLSCRRNLERRDGTALSNRDSSVMVTLFLALLLGALYRTRGAPPRSQAGNPSGDIRAEFFVLSTVTPPQRRLLVDNHKEINATHTAMPYSRTPMLPKNRA